MTNKPPFEFESLFYYKEGNDYFIKNANDFFREYWRNIDGYNKFHVVGTRASKDTFKFADTDSEKLSLIFSSIFNKTISKDQIEQHAGKPNQLQATKAASAPTNTPAPTSSTTTKSNTQPKTPIRQSPSNSSTQPTQTNKKPPAPLPHSPMPPPVIPQNVNPALQANQQMPASKTPSAPVSKSTTEVVPQANLEFTFDNLFYYQDKYKNDDAYIVVNDKFIELYKKKEIYLKLNISGRQVKKGIYAVMTSDPKKLSEIFTQIFETTITPEQVVEHTRKSTDPVPVQMPASKTPSTPPSQITSPKIPNPTPSAAKTISTPIQNNNASNIDESILNQQNTIFLTSSQYEKLICLLGAPQWMTRQKMLNLMFDQK